MKKIIFGCILCSMMAINATAQDNNGAPRQRMDRKEMIERRVKDMTEKYGLTAEQAEKVKALNEKYMGQMGPRGQRGGARRDSTRQRPATDGNTGASAQQQRPQRQPGQGGAHGMGRGAEGMKKYNEELQTILTPEQFKAYQEDMQKRMQRGGQRGGQQ